MEKLGFIGSDAIRIFLLRSVEDEALELLSTHLDEEDIAALGCADVPKGILEPMSIGMSLNKVKDFQTVKASETTRDNVEEWDKQLRLLGEPFMSGLRGASDDLHKQLEDLRKEERDR